MKWVILFSILASGAFASDMDFNQALDLMLKNDTYLPPAKAEYDSEKTGRLSSALQFLPSVETGYKKNQDYKDDLKTDTRYISGSFNLFKGGADLYAFQSKRYAVNKMEGKIQRLELDREGNAIKQLIQMILTKRKLKVHREMVTIKERSMKLASEKYERGLIPHDEVLKAQVDLQNTLASLSNIELSYQDSRKEVESILGVFEVSDVWPWQNKLHKTKDIKVDINEENHPRVMELKNQYYEMESRQNYYRGLLLPSVDFTMTWQKNEILKQTSSEKVGVLSVSWTLFDGLFKWSNYKSKSAERVEAQYALIREQNNIKEELKSAKNKLLISLETARKRDETLLVSKRLYEKNIQRFNQGKISLTDLEWEQNRLLTSENLACEGWAQAHISFQEFCHLNGKSIKECL